MILVGYGSKYNYKNVSSLCIFIWRSDNNIENTAHDSVKYLQGKNWDNVNIFMTNMSIYFTFIFVLLVTRAHNLHIQKFTEISYSLQKLDGPFF